MPVKVTPEAQVLADALREKDRIEQLVRIHQSAAVPPPPEQQKFFTPEGQPVPKTKPTLDRYG